MNIASGQKPDTPHLAASFEERLARFTLARLGGKLESLRRLTGGASQELWSFDAAGPTGRTGYVLRRSSGSVLGDKLAATGLETEAAVIRAMEQRDIPIARVAHVLVPDDDLGTGFVAARMAGEALGRRIVRDDVYAAIRPQLARDFGTILARIHTTPLESLPPLPRRTPAESIDLLEAQLRAIPEPRPVFEAALLWLRRNCPEPGPERLVHGDFRTGNYLLAPEGITAVLDWEVCHLGDPMSDLGWLCMPTWRFGRLDLPAGGVGTREALFAAYTRESGVAVDPDRVGFWQVRGILRWGLTCMFMAEAFLTGERSLERAAVGRRASEAEIELLHMLTKDR